jgi:peptide-methionine (S)-S-oxide reductase
MSLHRSGMLMLLCAAALVVVAVGMRPGVTGASSRTRAAGAPPADREVAIFAGGCFWCMEPPFERISGVDSVLSGFAGGRERSPSYKQVTSGRTGHAEAVRVQYDPERVSYDALLRVFWRNVDPLDGGGQFCDRGGHYRSAIFPVDESQRRAAQRSLEQVAERFGGAIATRLESTRHFWIAEEYHQDYYKKNPREYHAYRAGCGRDARLRQLWGSGGP